MSDLEREHGRLVARLKRQSRRAGEVGLSDDRARRMLETVRELIVVEKLMRMDEVQRAATPRDRIVVSSDEVRRRMVLMTPGAGLEVAG